ncbi:unnamed protein product [Rotaria sp. Silwood2]|nr:unnamed protein product [Rotaria sp. Silwood2]CAF4368603.1 unnamed protein product [Rotaria sp. Silwood2]
MSVTDQGRSHEPSIASTARKIAAPTSCSPDEASSSKSQEPKEESRCLTWMKLTSGALIPLMIGIGTVVITVLQQQLDTRRQNQERELDNRRYDLERLIDDRRYALQQEQANELHYQDVFKTYIADVSNAVFKQQQSSLSQLMFANDQKRFAYIRSQTLTALSDLDWHRRARLFLFLHENDLLPRIKAKYDENLSLDLSGAYLANITIKSTRYKKVSFMGLSLMSVDLTNASFFGCQFLGGADFSESFLNDARFIQSTFECIKMHGEESYPNSGESIYFDHASLQRANFQDSKLCDINFENTDLASANFNNVWFDRAIEFEGANLAFADFIGANFQFSLSMTVSNANLTGSSIMDNDGFTRALRQRGVTMDNVILPNGTWLADGKNLVRNGNAEIDVSKFNIL